MADLTLIEGNPASRLRKQYDHLMGIGDVDHLKIEAMHVVSGIGVSDKNVQKFKKTLTEKRTLTDVQFYVTNFVLRAAGEGVIGTPGGRR